MEKSSADCKNYKIIDHGRTMGWKFESKMSINQAQVGALKTAREINRKRIEKVTKTDIKVNDQDYRSAEAIIKGNNEESVISAIERIELFKRGRFKQRFTHFLSICFASEEIKVNFAKFKEEIMNDPEIEIDESLFQKPEKLHLTLTMLVLVDDVDEKDACKSLASCEADIVDKILQKKVLNLEMTGVSTMSADPAKSTVVYGKIDSKKLQAIANQLTKYFADRGLVQVVRSHVTLHVTLMNTSFLKKLKEKKPTNQNPSAATGTSQAEEEVSPKPTEEVKSISQDEKSSDEKSRFKPRHFDATKIIEKFKDFKFGSTKFFEIQISKLGSISNETGFYDSLDILKF